MKLITTATLCITLLLGACNTKKTDDNHSKKHHEKHHEKHHGTHNEPNKHMNKTSFGDLVNIFEDEERANWQKPSLVIEKLGAIEGKEIGDIGAGTGYFSFRLAKLGAKVTAIDVDERFQNFIKNKISKEHTTNLKTKLVGFDNPELSPNEFDRLLIVNTYHHFNDKIGYMTHCFDGLKAGGVLMNVDFKNIETAHGPPLNHRMSADEVEKDLLKVGFIDVQIDQTTLPEQYIITAKKGNGDGKILE